MGYFSNGTEGEDFYAKWCARCIHESEEPGCSVWLAHQIHNYDECNNPSSILHMLIPRSKDGPGNEMCTMFVNADNFDTSHPDLFRPPMKGDT